MTTYEKVCQIRDRFQWDKIDGVVVDVQTAGAIHAVGEKLNPENAEKFKALPIEKMADTAWKLLAQMRRGAPA